MPGPLLIPALAAGASILNTASDFFTNQAQKKWSLAMYERQRADALADRDWAVNYNSPAAQMQRLRDAKLNPNLVYGNGTDATAGSAGVPRGSSVEAWRPQAPHIDTGGLMSYYDVQLKEAAIDNAKATNDILKQEKLLKWVATESAAKDLDKKNVDLGIQPSGLSYYQEFKEAQLKSLQANIDNMQARTRATLDENERAALRNVNTLQEGIERIASMRLGRKLTAQQIKSIGADAELKQKELELRKSYNLSSSDPVYMRLLTYFLDKMGYQNK